MTFMWSENLLRGTVMTPNLEPFFAGTYFPRNRFKSVLSKIADMWEDDREQCESMGKNVIEQLKDMGGSVSGPNHTTRLWKLYLTQI